MDRLTMTSGKGGVALTFDLDVTCNKSEILKILKLAEKLKYYEDLEEQGLLLKLPCKVGDTVYEVQEIRKRIQSYTIISIHISNCSILFGWELKDEKGIYGNVNGFCDYAIGKTVFLTQAEAKAALKGMETNNLG